MRYALDILSILTIVPKTQLLLADPVAVLDEGGSTVSTVGESIKRHQTNGSGAFAVFLVFEWVNSELSRF